jgi:sterol desaturase/sphingolipid hydroxylase (fatty acid hydroxylase superfamily)
MKQKLKQLKEAFKNPPVERLTKIEYRNHFYLIVAYVFAGTMLYREGFWFIVPILLFSSLIAYVNGITAYNKHKVIQQFTPKEKPVDYEKDISPTRRRSKIINYIYGEKVSWGVAMAAVMLSIFVVDPTMSRWKLMIIYPSLIMILYILIYFFLLYWMAYPTYRLRMENLKGGNNDGENKKEG